MAVIYTIEKDAGPLVLEVLASAPPVYSTVHDVKLHSVKATEDRTERPRVTAGSYLERDRIEELS
jgi:hypothetical protein